MLWNNCCRFKKKIKDFISGQRIPRTHLLKSTMRNKLFVVGTAISTLTVVFRGLVSFLLRNEVYSIYQLIRNDYHWTTSVLSFLVYSFAEVILAVDLGVQFILNSYTVYMSCLVMIFWLKKIWYLIMHSICCGTYVFLVLDIQRLVCQFIFFFV